MEDKEPLSQNPYVGRMNDPSAAAIITGPCGDTMEIYLVVTDGMLETVRYHTDGCRYTHLCGSTVAGRAQGKSLPEALTICPGQLLQEFGDRLPLEHRHCAILAVSTLYRAIGQYWVDWARS